MNIHIHSIVLGNKERKLRNAVKDVSSESLSQELTLGLSLTANGATSYLCLKTVNEFVAPIVRSSLN